MSSIMDKLGNARRWAVDVALHPERYDQTAVMLVDVIRVVEMLAMERKDKPDVAHVDDALIDRLATVAAEAFYRDESGKERDWEHVARAILTELGRQDKPAPASSGHDALPTPAEVAKAYWGPETYNEMTEDGHCPDGHALPVVDLVRARVMPELSSRDKRIAELEAKILELERQIPGRSPANEDDGGRLRRIVAGGAPRSVDGELAEALVAERWERRAHEFSRPYRERIAELEAQDHHTGELLAKTHAAHVAAEARVTELEKRLSELTTPVTVDGKTPGQTLQNAMRNGEQSWESAAQAVLRTFGPALAKQAAVDALGRVRDRIHGTERLSSDTDYGKLWVHVADVLEAVDEEIASLETPTPTSNHVQELGSCSLCDKRPTGQEFVKTIESRLPLVGIDVEVSGLIHWGMVDDVVGELFEQWRAKSGPK